MSKRSRLPGLIIGGIIPSRDPCCRPVPLQSLTATGNNTLSIHHLLNGFCGANRSATTVLYHRNQRPEGTALIDPSSGHGHNNEMTIDSKSLIF